MVFLLIFFPSKFHMALFWLSNQFNSFQYELTIIERNAEKYKISFAFLFCKFFIYLLPAGPGGAGGPGGPGGTGGPGGPGSPVGPRLPALPIGPWGPWDPSEPGYM